MAVAVVIDNPDLTREVYDSVNTNMDLTGPPEGMIIHTAGVVDGVFRIFDVWESLEDYDRFAEQKLLPAIVAVVGEPQGPPPSRTVYELHDMIRP